MSKTRRKTLEQDSEQSQSREKSEVLSKKSDFPNQKLQQLVYDDQKYINTIIKYINKSLNKIINQEYPAAMYLLAEAEKTLEYGANCGRIINRRLIICVLHNEACCFQKESQWSKSVKYVQAIIFNFKAYLQSLENCPYPSSSCSSQIKNREYANSVQISYVRNLELAQYYQQFCSMKSQLKDRKQALEAAKNGIELYKSFFSQFRKQWRNYEQFDSCSDEERKRIEKVLTHMKIFNDRVQMENFDEYLKMGKQISRKWTHETKVSFATNIEKYTSNYSIGHLVSISPLQYEQIQTTKNYMEGKQIILQIVHWAMGYFQIATEYRLLAEEKYGKEIRSETEEFRLSSIYHLLAIILIGIYVPFDLLFMNQILTGFQVYYQINLLVDEDQRLINEDLMFMKDSSSRVKFRDPKENSELKKMATMKRKKITEGVKNPISGLKKKLSAGKIKNYKESGLHIKQEYFEKNNENAQTNRKRVSTSSSKKSSLSSKEMNGKKPIKSNNTKKKDNFQKKTENILHLSKGKKQISTFRNKRIVSSSTNLQTSIINPSKKVQFLDLLGGIDEYGTNKNLQPKENPSKRQTLRNSRSNSLNGCSQIIPNRKITSQGSIREREFKQTKQQKKSPNKISSSRSPKSGSSQKKFHKKTPKQAKEIKKKKIKQASSFHYYI